MERDEPTTNEEYIARVIRLAKEQENETVKSHAELLEDYEK